MPVDPPDFTDQRSRIDANRTGPYCYFPGRLKQEGALVALNGMSLNALRLNEELLIDRQPFAAVPASDALNASIDFVTRTVKRSIAAGLRVR
ncbi:hypothetical protein [Mycolicibacterium arseniciresistens]|uniref:Uncharacterized protein n=1 Tax=Mycolicibacterium arseniciresistens TaxID=3062257 RepID=A0ABT8UBH0_9MYCO|nr:hypothetical protein [Mycolicibacterium arseniciresistens]MDO3635134.1 hypothetical protein [Mycolicibacterium arseniciresistens]